MEVDALTPEAGSADAGSCSNAGSLDPVSLDALTEALDRLGRVDPAVLADPESVVSLQRQLARLEALTTRATAAFDRAGHWAPDGARTASAWLSVRCRIPKAEARRRVRRGRALAPCPRPSGPGPTATSPVPTSTSWPPCPVPRPRRPWPGTRPCSWARPVICASTSSCQAVAYWKQLADPEGADAEAEARRARRDVYLVTGFAGSWLGAMTLDPVSGAIVSAELERLEHDLFEAEWAEARDALGHDPTPAELARTPGQRRADALVEMATRSKSCSDDARRPAPLFTVLVG